MASYDRWRGVVGHPFTNHTRHMDELWPMLYHFMCHKNYSTLVSLTYAQVHDLEVFLIVLSGKIIGHFCHLPDKTKNLKKISIM